MPGLFRRVSWGSPKGASVLSQFPSQSSRCPGWYGVALRRVIGGEVAGNGATKSRVALRATIV